MFAMCGSLQAANILFASGDGVNENVVYDPDWLAYPTVLITPNAAWEPNHTPGGKWISFADTGEGGIVVPNTDLAWPTAWFQETFYLTSPTNINVRVWADDTAAVYMNGQLIHAANPNQDGACAAGVIGCVSSEGLNVNLSAPLLNIGSGSAGFNSFVVAAYQRGGNGFGVMYEATVPEPATLAFFGLGIAVIAGRKYFISRI
jgi:hypothetical protein